MWINCIKLKNFKSYDNAEFVFPEPREGKNLVIIGAKNGHGKTTLLEAIYLGMYDKDAISHLERAGLTEQRNYKEYLSSALYHGASSSDNQYVIEITIELMKRNIKKESLEGIRIYRKWYLDKQRQVITENNEEVISSLNIDGTATPLHKDEAISLFNSHALPIDYAPFFFFDGEKIVSTARSTGAGVWLNKALRGLLGVTLLEQLKDSLEEYRKQYIREVASDKVLGQLTELDNKLLIIQAKVDEYKVKVEDALTQREKLQAESNQIMKILGSGSDIQSKQDISAELQNVQEDFNSFQLSVKSAVEAMPLSFLPRLELDKLITKLEHEKNRLDHEAGKEQIEGKVERFWQQFVKSDKVREVLGRSAEGILNDELMKEAVQECWELLYYPLPDKCAENITHNYLSQTAHSNIVAEYEKLNSRVNESSISELILKMEKSKINRDKLRRQLDDIKSNGNDERIERLKEVQDDIEKIVQNLAIAKSNLDREEGLKNSVKQDIERLNQQIISANPKQQKAQRAQITQDMIDSLIRRLMSNKTAEVADVATRINRKIAHGNRISRVDIDKFGQMTLFGSNNKEMNVDLSAGQIQILMMSLISAMAEVTDYVVPLVIDTPLARLDIEHREGIFDHWISLKQQVILLSQNSEVTPDVVQKLKPYINKTYLIGAEALPTGGARSEIKENEYFELRD